MRRRLHGLLRVAEIGLLALTFSCSATRPTQLIVVVDSDLDVPGQLTSLEIDVEGIGTASQRAVGNLVGPAAQSLPRSLALVYDGGPSGPFGPITVTARGMFESMPVVERTARVHFVANEVRVLRLDLARSCVGLVCPDSQTCRGGRACTDNEVTADQLEPWPDMVTRFDAGPPTDACLGIELCNGLDDDCDGLMDEGIDLMTDLLNCGMCGNACPDRDNAEQTCVGDRCGFDCDDGFADCNAEGSDGCENSLDSLEDCGACGSPCTVAAGMATCLTRECAVASCDVGRDDCDMDPTNGCEADLRSVATCGSCTACMDGELCFLAQGSDPAAAVCRSPSEALSIAAGGGGGDNGHSCAVLVDGSVRCWGDNREAQLGRDGADSLTPVAVTGLPGVVSAVTTGSQHSCAISGGAVYCWGKNDRGQCGVDGEDPSSPSTRVAGLTDAVEVAAGVDFTCVRRGGGEVACFGENNVGQLGRVVDDGRPYAARDISELADVTDIGVGGSHACAVRGGEVWCWGRNDKGQLGRGDGEGPMPRQVGSLPETAVEVAAGSAHTCARLADGRVWCWGENSAGQLGTDEGGDRPMPRLVAGLTDAVRVFAGGDTTCVLHTGGALSCFGADGTGQLGAGTNDDSSMPIPVTGETTVVDASVGSSHVCAVRRDGTAACWGDGGRGRLGSGTTDDANTPTPVSGIGGT